MKRYYAIDRELTIKYILSNLDYIKWLITITKDIGSISNKYLDKLPDGSTKDNLSILNLFYEGISSYALKNYIYPININGREFYRIKLDNFWFEIGFSYNVGMVYYCRRVVIENENDFIDFNDIMTNKRASNVISIEKEDYYINTNFKNNEEFKKFLVTIQKRSINDFNIELNGDDQILTLSTCANGGLKRVVLHAKLVNIRN